MVPRPVAPVALAILLLHRLLLFFFLFHLFVGRNDILAGQADLGGDVAKHLGAPFGPIIPMSIGFAVICRNSSWRARWVSRCWATGTPSTPIFSSPVSNPVSSVNITISKRDVRIGSITSRSMLEATV